MQQYAGIYLLQNYSTCFGCPSHPSSGVHKTVTAASGTGHSICNFAVNKYPHTVASCSIWLITVTMQGTINIQFVWQQSDSSGWILYRLYVKISYWMLKCNFKLLFITEWLFTMPSSLFLQISTHCLRTTLLSEPLNFNFKCYFTLEISKMTRDYFRQSCIEY